jgi:tripartite ATP-independent transporter DctM subunit
MGGLIAGLILSGFYIAYILIRCYFQPHLGPAVPREERMIPLTQKFVYLKGLIIPLLLMCAVLGSIFFGLATPTEASGVGALGAIVSSAVHRRLSWENLKYALFQTVKATCMIAWIFFGVAAFSAVFTLAGASRMIENFILGLPLCRWGILVAMQIFYLIMGVPMDWLGNLMITGPIFIPIIKELGFCAVWFGVLFNVNMQIAYLSPPVGTSMYYLKGVSPPEITMGDIFRAVLPFVACQLVALALMIAFPEIIMWLPELMRG